MKKFILILALTLAIPSAFAADKDEKEVKEAAVNFYSALNAMFTGDVEPMKNVWSHADDVTYMGPGGGIKTGWEEVLKSWEEQAALHLGGKVEAEGLKLNVGKDLAVVQNYENGTNKDEKVSIRATNIFRKEKGEWKMIGHHTDILPHLQKKTDAA